MSDDERPSPGGMVIHLFGPPPAVDGAPSVDRDGSSLCSSSGHTWHPHSPVVDKISRTVSCRHCKRALDPIDVLLEVARKYDEWVRLSEETRTMRREIEALRTEEKRVRARTKSHTRKDAAEAVAAEREKLARQRAEIACKTDDARRALRRIDQLIGRRDPSERRSEREGR